MPWSRIKKPLVGAVAALSATLAVIFFVSAATWTDRSATSGTRTWYGIACSSDCGKILAVDNTDTSASMYLSPDAGATWNALTGAGVRRWKHAAISSDGTKMLVSELDGWLWYSGNSGTTWATAATIGTGQWTGVDMSDDGTTMVAIANGGGKVGFWKSTDSGSTWSNPSGLGSTTPNAIACSSDCSKIIVGMFGDYIYRSTDTGANWGALTGSTSGFYTSVASSSDGSKLASTLSFGGPLSTSSNSGSTWTDQADAGTGGAGLWQSVAMSSDGSKLLAVSTAIVRTSTNSGVSWSTESAPGTATWRKAAMSSDGAYMVVGGTNTGIWTSGTPPAVAPTVTTQSASSITTTTVTLNGTISSTGNATPTTRGFEYGTSVSYGQTIFATGSFAATPFAINVTGLTCNTGYHYRAYATNTAGTGYGSDTSFTTSTCPVAPTVSTGTATRYSYGAVTLSGTISSTGGEDPTSRYVEYGLTTSYGSSTTESGSFATGSFTSRAVGLAQGTTYHYRMCAVNTAGTGCGSDSTFTTLAAPGQPTSLSGTVGYAQVALSWSAPLLEGDYSLTDYLVEYKLSADSTWTAFPHTAATGTTMTVTGLANGSAYDFRVSGVSYAGAGTPSSTISRTPSSTPTAPNAPTALSGTASSGQVSLTWAAPANGGSALTDYVIQYKTLTATSYTTFSDGTSTTAAATVTGLTNGTGYNFRVAAVNGVGTSSYSSAITVGVGGATYLHILSTGQSLAEGVNSDPALSTTQPYNNLSLSNSPIAGTSGPLISLIEGFVARESPASGMANSLRAADSVLARPIIASIHAGGGQTYASIKKGGTGGYYTTGQTQASTAKTLTEADGAYYQPYAVTIVHGESDAIAGTTAATYAADMAELQSDYESDWNALTGRSDSIPLFLSQMNTNSLGTIGVSQFTAHKNNPGKVILVGPKYQLGYGADHLHLTNTASKYMGELYAKVMKKVLLDGATWDPLMPVSVTRSGTTVLVDYHIPYGTLAVDTTNVASHTNKGFEFTQTGGSAISITSVNLTDSNKKVAITLSGVPDGTDPRIRYAWTCSYHPDDAAYAACGDPTDSTAVGGNIRDTDTSTSPSSDGTGIALYDWSVSFDEEITETTYPNAPTSLAVTPASTQATLVWLEPEVDGGDSLSDYIVEYKTGTATSWTTFSDGTSTATSATVTGLSNGTLYAFRVSAVNSVGRSNPSAVAYSTPGGAPNAPTSLSATGGNAQASLSWTAPSDGGSPITDYVIEYKLSTDSTWTTFSDGTSTSTNAIVTGLSNNTAYNFRVYAVNASGTSSASSTANATTSGVPDAPTSLAAVSGNMQITLSWTAPAANGSAITDYVIQYQVAPATYFTIYSDGISVATSATITGLTNGVEYTFIVYAVNDIGTSSGSSSTTGTPATTPDEPISLSVTPGNTQVVLTWLGPLSDGGDAITDYVVEYKTSVATSWSTFSDGTSTATGATVTSLSNGTAYDFRVSAVNGVGTGTVSSTESATPRTTPGAPTSLGTTAGDSQVALAWTAPVSNGGSAITDYVIEYKLHADSSWTTFSDGTSTSTSATVTGLTNGSSYDFRVYAVNGAGTSTASSPATDTPLAVPSAPTGLSATAGNGQVGLSWGAPVSDGGDAITDYIVEYKLSTDSSWTTFSDGTSTSTSTTVTGLSNGSSYNFRVSAVNGVGTGSASSTATATPSTTPGTPSGLAATAGDEQVTLSWTAASSGGSAITDYLIEYKLSADSVWTTFADGTSAAVSAVVTGLTNDSSYDFRVTAVNINGSGSASSTATATPVDAPAPAPTTTTRRTSVNYILALQAAQQQAAAKPSQSGGQPGTTYVSPVDQSVKKCPAFVSNFVSAAKSNNIDEVKQWQAFYNQELGTKLPVTGYFGPLTMAATRQFQTKYKAEVLTPGGLKNATGTIYGYTRAKANAILGCAN